MINILKLKEEWKPITIKKHKTNYYISNFGRVYSVKTNKILKAAINSTGYLIVSLYYSKKQKTFKVHRLVALSFVSGKSKTKNEVNHKDCDKLNNYAYNLEWCTRLQNQLHAIKNNRLKKPKRITLSDYSTRTIKFIKKKLIIGYSKNYIKLELIHNDDKYPLDLLSKDIIKLIKLIDKRVLYNPILDIVYILAKNDSNITESDIHNVCRCLEENKLTYHEISKLTGVSVEMISYIKNKKIWTSISNRYNINNYDLLLKQKKENDIILSICEDLNNNINYDIICNKYNISKQSLYNIYSGKT